MPHRSVAAFKIRSVFGIAFALVHRILRIGAERPAAAWERWTRSYDPIGRPALLDPVDDGLQKIELVEGRGTRRAMPHTGNEVRSAGIRANPRQTAGALCHPLVIIKRDQRREPGIADAVVEEYLSAAREEAVEVGPVRRTLEPIHSVPVEPILDRVDVHGFEKGGIDGTARAGDEHTG